MPERLATGPGATGPLLVPGRTVWRLARADRLAFIVDAADYFATLKAAIAKARHAIYLIGWDFDTRIALEPEGEAGEGPNKLGDVINAAVERCPGLQVYVLKWDFGLVQSLGRGATPLFILDWITSRRIHFRLDTAHPLGGCHHQKIAVIDDALAFCGGIDTTVGRWDTREHLDEDERRNSPSGTAQGPWHDATTAVDGDAARALGDLARRRWHIATGEALQPAGGDHQVWPDGLRPTFRDLEVGISRTEAAHGEEAEVREVEALTLAAIAGARRSIYVESQYLASSKVGDALVERLRERDGPEVVVVNPETAEGWLEEKAMGSARALIVGRLREADREDRFRIYHPVTAGGAPIYVHAKILIVDDRLLRVGSSNLNNRSMGLDSECDIAVEVVPGIDGEEAIRAAIRATRDDLLAEHLGLAPAEFAACLREEGGSLVRAVDRLRTPDGRTLRPLDPPDLNAAERTVAEQHVLDPERPVPAFRYMSRLLSSGVSAARRSVLGRA